MQYAMLGILLGLMILYFVYFYFKNKRDKENYKNVLDNIKKGTNVLTSAGIVGKVISIQEKDGMKTITIETGNESKKGYLTFDIQAVYMVLDPIDNLQPQENNNDDNNTQVEDNPVEPSEIVNQQPTVKNKTKNTKK